MATDSSVRERPRRLDYGDSDWIAAVVVEAGPRSRRRRRRTSSTAARRAAPDRGAIRLPSFGAIAPTSSSRLPRVAVGLAFAAGGALVTTTSIGTVEQAPLRSEPAVALAPPSFYFDDATDALSERAAAAAVDEPAAEGPTLAMAVPSISRATDTDTVPAPSAAPLPPAVEADPIASPPEPTSVDVDTPATIETVVAVAAGDTLSEILHAYGLGATELRGLLADDLVERYLTRLEIGQELRLAHRADGTFESLATRVGDDTRVTVRREGRRLVVTTAELPVERERVVTSGTIERSLYVAADAAKLQQSTIMALADIFQWELDFSRDIRPGDHFAIVYDRLYRDGEYIGDGEILAAEFRRGARVHHAIAFTAADGTRGYYAPDGSAKRRTFLRHPVDVVRITSRFDPERMHPVLHQIRAHRGVDYGAPHGSPIRATADGVIVRAGPRGAYGNTVELKHGEGVTTLYAHMSRISEKSRVGQRVRQGEVIGYVGRSGRVTGTHLHYEFRVDGVHVDPLTVELPAAAALASDQRDALRAVADEMTAQMESVLSERSVTGRTATGRTAAGGPTLPQDIDPRG